MGYILNGKLFIVEYFYEIIKVYLFNETLLFLR